MPDRPRKLQDIAARLDRSQTWLSQVRQLPRHPTAPTDEPRPHRLHSRQSVLFYRDFQGLTGGHLKVWDYFNHVLRSPHHIPYIYFYGDTTVWDASNPWANTDPSLICDRPLENPDLLFIDGLDWSHLPGQYRLNSPIPILNLIQHIRHTDPSNSRYPFLQHKAIRICVSEAVHTALLEAGCVNGPIFLIPNGLDETTLPPPANTADKDIDILIAALKEPDLGQQLQARLETQGRSIYLLRHGLLRPDYLQLVRRAKTTIFLPNRHEGEGFYLPALEAMALNTLVICPDCVGNRNFCRPGENCYRPDYNLESILQAVDRASQLSGLQRESMLTRARQTFQEYNLAKERKAFYEVLNNVLSIWQN